MGSASGYSPSPCWTSGPGWGNLSSELVLGELQPLPTSAKSIPGRLAYGIVAAAAAAGVPGWSCGVAARRREGASGLGAQVQAQPLVV